MIAALPGALLIGLSLGILGSGGSILTVPVLTYLIGQGEKVAIASSLAIVGLIALASAVPYALRRQIDGRSVLYFGGPGMVGGYIGAALGAYVPSAWQMIAFAIVMVVASVFMLRPRPLAMEEGPRRPIWKIAFEGICVGILTGLVGVGGGFLVVPALVLLGGLSMTRAVGTSLVIIALKSATSFWKSVEVLAVLRAKAPPEMRAALELDPLIIGVVAGVGILGALGGTWIAPRLPQPALRKGFALLCIAIALPVAWSGLAPHP